MKSTANNTKIRTIVFIEPRNEHLHIYSRFELPRLGSILLATIMRNLGYHTKAYFLTIQEIKKRNLKPDLVCISTITTTAIPSYNLAIHFRSLGIPVVMGGPHVSALPEEAIQYADYVIVGEGEKVLPLLVRALQGSYDIAKVPGLFWKSEKKIYKNSENNHISDLDSNPPPDWSLMDMGNRKTKGKRKKITIPVQTSRGCPHDCSFCSVTQMFGRRFRYRSTESIISEIKQYDPEIHSLFFVDDNFTASRKRTIELLDAMIENKFNFTWSTQVRVELAQDRELLNKMHNAGCRYLYIGFESVNPESLIEMNKHQTPESIEYAIKVIRKTGIHIHGMFVFGFDSDTIDSCKATVKFAIKKKIDSVQFLILTPLPGTQFYNKMMEENRLVDRNWNEYDAHHAKFRPKNFTLAELQEMQIQGHQRFYTWWNNLARLIRGKLSAFVIGVYAHYLNYKWKRAEKKYLKRIRIIPDNSQEADTKHELFELIANETT
ncbi:MAG: B12-binding domain-containing radical SAM protein [Candidatus Lokiarchaeota archaeon]|nr:B12-binding domain-containing radical SAM protein [Candidatus Lokiarchaeota archaeon]